MNKYSLAKILSVIFNPVIFLVLSPFLIVYKEQRNLTEAVYFALFTSIFISLGVFYIWYGVKKGFYSDTDLSNREQRSKFYKIALVLALVYFVLLIFFKGMFYHLTIASFGVFLGVIFLLIVNHTFKTSIHLTAVSAFFAVSTVYYGILGFFLTVWIIPVVSWSRLLLKKHTLREVFLGIFFGILITIITFFIGRQV